MELNIPEIKEIKEIIKSMKDEIEKKSSGDLSKEWYNDEQCWRLKGGMALNTYRTNRFYQCKGGVPDGFVGGRKVWRRESVLEWLPLIDSELEEYHRKYRTGAKRK